MTDLTYTLDQIDAACENATDGPWMFEEAGDYECGESSCCYEYWDNRIRANGEVLTESHMLTEENAAFIALARTALPELAAKVRELEARIDHFTDSRGVNIGSEDSDWWRGCRQAQRECLIDARALKEAP